METTETQMRSTYQPVLGQIVVVNNTRRYTENKFCQKLKYNIIDDAQRKTTNVVVDQFLRYITKTFLQLFDVRKSYKQAITVLQRQLGGYALTMFGIMQNMLFLSTLIHLFTLKRSLSLCNKCDSN